MDKKLKLFISSVFNEFKVERQKLKDFIEKEFESQVEVYLSENDEKPEKTSEEKLTEAINGCDIYLLLLGGQFGSKHPNKDISITQWEFENAGDLHKQRLVFYKENVTFEERQEKFKEEVFDFVDGKDCVPFSDDDKLKQKIKKHLLIIISECAKMVLPVLNDEHKRGKLFIKAEPLRAARFRGDLSKNKNGFNFQLKIKFYNRDKEYDHSVDNIRLVIWGKDCKKVSYANRQGRICYLPLTIRKRSPEIIDVEFCIKSPSDNDSENQEKLKELYKEFEKLKNRESTDFLKVYFDVV